MEPVLSSNPESLLERAYVDAVEQVADLDEARSRVLDAAYDQFSRLGIQRSTMEDVARRAGVSRITVYRRFATKDALVEQVIRREFRRYFDRFLIDIEQAETAADRVVLGFVSSMRAIRSNTLIGGLMATEPDTVLPTMINDEGRTLATVRRFVAGQLRREQRAGTVPDDLDVDFVAEMMVRVSASFLAIPSELVDLDDDEQVAEVARRFLVPMLESGGPSA
ncbi:TetR/AcrR family transcriptional regulator [Actinomadura madurae]|uniref:TetR/AcrR family transcriptional regulator n=1 Tax=Actinomadura madurae TaxID=1993 RepID=UPI0020260FD2|nr:TetR/AcrR family transcriptional regulator [Actinomadura madurae]MCP9951752.1 TetR/AcrR family transcriptional regulator [Actinomadura madurae]MCP9968522.1 TetR/AcrR family transcriptional regulator [Actinomadura madurae]MCP9980991.1 TetR/AcrR family transcriptional regulator [Actinomadura madurae]MCQ0007509.1 TetR/AcrR family transcriptional regulator [Actinomadura madurae]MCQ0017189.1 TetR/AcrR family transcriptional regulator [Actinomadura madurae]